MRAPYISIATVLNGVGDAVLALPCVRHLRELAKGEFYVATSSELKNTVFEELQALTLAIDDEDGVDHARLLDLAERIKAQSTQVRWYSLSSYAPLREWEKLAVALFQPCSHVRLSDHVFNSETGLVAGGPMRDAYFHALGLPRMPDDLPRALSVSPKEEAAARLILERSGINGKRRLAVFHTDTTNRSKCWPSDRWSELAGYLLRDNWNIVVVGCPSWSLGSGVASLGGMSWRLQVAVLKRAQLFVGVDSCFAHVADGFGVGGVVLFGPTSAETWGPRGPNLRPVIAPDRDLQKLSSDYVSGLLGI